MDFFGCFLMKKYHINTNKKIKTQIKNIKFKSPEIVKANTPEYNLKKFDSKILLIIL